MPFVLVLFFIKNIPTMNSTLADSGVYKGVQTLKCMVSMGIDFDCYNL